MKEIEKLISDYQQELFQEPPHSDDSFETREYLRVKIQEEKRRKRVNAPNCHKCDVQLQENFKKGQKIKEDFQKIYTGFFVCFNDQCQNYKLLRIS